MATALDIEFEARDMEAESVARVERARVARLRLTGFRVWRGGELLGVYRSWLSAVSARAGFAARFGLPISAFAIRFFFG